MTSGGIRNEAPDWTKTNLQTNSLNIGSRILILLSDAGYVDVDMATNRRKHTEHLPDTKILMYDETDRVSKFMREVHAVNTKYLYRHRKH